MPDRSLQSKPVASAVRRLLEAAPAFAQLPPERRREIARDTARVAALLADPSGLTRAEFRAPLLGRPPGASVPSFDALVHAVDFPAFVAGLIEGVFGAIVNASLEQMEAYGELIKRVAETVDQFVEEGLDDRGARDWLLESFPDLFSEQDGRFGCRPDADKRAWLRLNGALHLRRRVASGDTRKVIQAARRRLARTRQQQLAMLVMMGINRIVVTDGRIRATGRRTRRR